MCKTISESPIVINGQSIQITVSMGVASKLGPDSIQSTTIHRADSALYEAKNLGRTKLWFQKSDVSLILVMF
jgi:PleD family two-component response regulator